MVALWWHYGRIVVALWWHYGGIMVALWSHYGGIMVALWWHYGRNVKGISEACWYVTHHPFVLVRRLNNNWNKSVTLWSHYNGIYSAIIMVALWWHYGKNVKGQTKCVEKRVGVLHTTLLY